MIEITAPINERSTGIIRFNFNTVSGVPFVPKTCKWSLCKKDGTIMNNRLDVPVSVTQNYYDFVVSGNDLILDDNEATRSLIIEGTFDLIANGETLLDQDYREEVQFPIAPISKDTV
jgi:hypothetical protein